MHIVIVEDEPVIAQRLKRFVSELLAKVDIHIFVLDNIDDAESYLAEKDIDLLLLDLNLHGASGFNLLSNITAQSFHTIIVSAYAEQAITAFEYGVLDFVAKPFSKERLSQALNRFLDKDSIAAKSAKKLSVKKGNSFELISLEDVCYIKADGHYTQLKHCNGQEHLHDKAIEKLSKLLPKHFKRIHRSYIVNTQHVDSLKVSSGGVYHIKLKNELELPVSRARYQQLKQELFIS